MNDAADFEALSPADLPADSAGGQLADRIARDVAESRSVPGTVIASELELRTLHDAGRSVFRQAVRILEERGIAYMRRGHGGGLVVAEPNADFAARGLSIALESMAGDLDLLSVLLAAIDTHLFLHGASRLTIEKGRDLRRLAQRLDDLPDDEFLRVRAHRQLDRAIRTASGEPAVTLAYRTSSEFGLDLIPYSIATPAEGAKSEIWRTNCETIEALIAGDVAWMFDCRRRMSQSFELARSDWSQIERDPSLAPKVNDLERPEFQLSGNQADRLAREILREIRLMGWTPGARIGGGAELMKRYGASTNILRQAVRMLQEHSAVEVERGRNGGLFVAAPDRQRAIDRAIAFLRQSAPDLSDIRSFLVQIMLQAIERGPPVVLADLRRSLGPGPSVSLPELCRVLGAGFGEPTFMFSEILLSLLPEEPPSPITVRAVLDAFASGDRIERRRAVLACADAQP